MFSIKESVIEQKGDWKRTAASGDGHHGAARLNNTDEDMKLRKILRSRIRPLHRRVVTQVKHNTKPLIKYNEIGVGRTK